MAEKEGFNLAKILHDANTNQTPTDGHQVLDAAELGQAIEKLQKEGGLVPKQASAALNGLVKKGQTLNLDAFDVKDKEMGDAVEKAGSVAKALMQKLYVNDTSTASHLAMQNHHGKHGQSSGNAK